MKDEVKVCLIGSGRAGMIHGHNFKIILLRLIT